MKQTATERAWQHAYYVAHRAELIAKKKARYPKYYAENRDRILASNKVYRDVNRSRWNGYKREQRTGWTPERYDEMLSAQEGDCAVCGEHLDRQLQADHAGDQQRGLLCHHCNSGLGMFRDSAELLTLAAEYLESYREEVA